MAKKQFYEFTPHPLEEITHDGETFRAFFMTEDQILEFVERFEKLKPSVKQKIEELWRDWSGMEAPWESARHIKQHRQLIEQKYKKAMKA